jgi:tRNA G18 (ribose-2'-O)-methylase SpoU
MVLTNKHAMEAAWASPYTTVKSLILRKDKQVPSAWQAMVQERNISVRREKFDAQRHDHTIEMNVVWRLYPDCKQWRINHASADRELVIFLDRLQDPQNVGNIVRTACFFGASAVVIPKTRSAKIGETMVRASVGAALQLPVVHCTNLVREMKNFQNEGFYLWGLSPHESAILGDEKAPPAKIGLIIGSEGQGMASLTEKTCDQLFRLSKHAGVESLNASSAAAIAIYETANKLHP